MHLNRSNPSKCDLLSCALLWRYWMPNISPISTTTSGNRLFSSWGKSFWWTVSHLDKESNRSSSLCYLEETEISWYYGYTRNHSGKLFTNSFCLHDIIWMIGKVCIVFRDGLDLTRDDCWFYLCKLCYEHLPLNSNPLIVMSLLGSRGIDARCNWEALPLSWILYVPSTLEIAMVIQNGRVFLPPFFYREEQQGYQQLES